MAEAEESVNYSCYNCEYNGWKEPNDGSTIQHQQCAKCKKVRYCSSQCQKEHWFNVHKHHCKYLAKTKVLPHSVHKSATCPDCKVEAETGREEMCRPDNPVLGCASQNIDKSHLLPVSLGEMSGKFMTKADATLSLMSRILFKMKDISHTAGIIDPQSFRKLVDTIWVLRDNCMSEAFRFGNSGIRLDRAVCMVARSAEKEIRKLFENINIRLNVINFKETNLFRPWDTLKLLARTLFLSDEDGKRNMTERLGLPEMYEDFSNVRVTSDQFNGIWQKLLDTLRGKLVPYTSLVEIFCGGNLRQACYGCMKLGTVSEVRMLSLSDEESVLPGLTLMFGNVRAVLCDGEMCSGEVYEDIPDHENDLRKLYISKGCEGKAFMCDFCGLPGLSGNMGKRCSRCLTKVYCGEECRDGDWVVHKMVCREGEEERKRKGGQVARKMVAMANVKRILG